MPRITGSGIPNLPRPETGEVEVPSEITSPAAEGHASPPAESIPGLDPGRWSAFTDRRPAATITELTTPNMLANGLIKFEWEGSGDALPFELAVEVAGDPRKVRAELWTNADHNADPSTYEAHPMHLVRVEGSRAIYRVDLPVTRVGNYRATARVSTDNGHSFQWAGDTGTPDLRFRPRHEAHDGRDLMEIHVGIVNHHGPGTPGTFADLMESGTVDEDGKYTLEHIASLGKTDLWLQPPFLRSRIGKHPADDAGSPYATKDYFSIDPEYARAAHDLSGEAARNAALGEFDAFVTRAHEMDIKVHLDIALNHVGHNYEFRDLFVRYDEAGRRFAEVRRNDFGNIAIDEQHLDLMRARLADPELPDYAEYVAPHLFASRSDRPEGAADAADTQFGGWGEWRDTKQLNHGARWGVQRHMTPEVQETLDYLVRVMSYWAIEHDVDGFRIDHLTGMGPPFLEYVLNKVQAEVDRATPGKVLHFMGEDFNNARYLTPFVDTLQGGWFHELNRVRTPADLRHVFDSPDFRRSLVNLDSHDEPRFFNAWGDDWQGATRMGALLELMGGTTMQVAGTELGERQQLPFKQYRSLPSLRTMDTVKKQILKTFRRAGKARRGLAALGDDNRAWLQPRDGQQDINLVAVSRFPDADKEGAVVLLFANLADQHQRENSFVLDAETRRRIDPDRRYQVRDLMADDAFRQIWDPPRTGRELMDEGIFCSLRPYQIQCLILEPVDHA